MTARCGCEVCRSMPPIIDSMLERVQCAHLLGSVPFLIVVRGEDLAQVETWYGGPVNRYQDIPIKAIRGKEILATPAVLISLEEYREEYEGKVAECDASMPVVGLEPGECWVLALRGPDLARSD